MVATTFSHACFSYSHSFNYFIFVSMNMIPNLHNRRLLISPERHRDISTSEAKPSSILVPTHPDFRVIALGKPVPPYHGRTLDPPLRSRFQIR